MKQTKSMTFLIIIIICALINIAPGQEKKIAKKDVPQAVLSAFEKAYPKAKIMGYSTEIEEGKTYYEIEAMKGKKTLDVSYLADGTAAEIETGVAPKDLPADVAKAVKDKYPKGKIVKAEEKTVGAVVTYEMKVKSGKIKVGLEIDPNGKILKESKGKTEKED